MKFAPFIVCLFWFGPLWAETDYVCLKNCMDGGGVSHACMSSCTYGEQAADPLAKPPTHKVLGTLSPADTMASPPAPPIKPEKHKDFDCMNQCLQGHMQYQLCDERCTH